MISMRGLDEARALYEQRGRAAIAAALPDWEGRIAVGLAGRGSQCFGFDDELSRDHDFAQGFCLWLTDEDDVKIGVALARLYRSLGFAGAQAHSAMAEEGLGVRRISDFYRRYTGSDGAPESWQQWMAIPSWALAEATNGEVWRDELGEFSRLRETLRHGMPEDVRRKKLAAKLIAMAQAGQYNYPRCLKHGESGAAMLALGEFVNAASDAVFLLCRAHRPYYKWSFRAMRELPEFGQALCEPLAFLLTGENGGEGDALKIQLVEDICASVVRELRAQELSGAGGDYLESHAYAVQGSIRNGAIRALHVMEE